MPQKGLLILKYTYGEDGRLLKLEIYGKERNDQMFEKLYLTYNCAYMMTDSGYVVEQTSSYSRQKQDGIRTRQKRTGHSRNR